MYILKLYYLKKLIFVLLLVATMNACSTDSEEFNVFYFNLHKYEQGEVSKKQLILSYEKISLRISDIFHKKGKGTEINALCRFYSQIQQSDIDNFGLNNIILSDDKLLLKNFFDANEFSGNIYRDCVEPFNLKIKRFRS
jgi:hypothetical protein